MAPFCITFPQIIYLASGSLTLATQSSLVLTGWINPSLSNWAEVWWVLCCKMAAVAHPGGSCLLGVVEVSHRPSPTRTAQCLSAIRRQIKTRAAVYYFSLPPPLLHSDTTTPPLQQKCVEQTRGVFTSGDKERTKGNEENWDGLQICSPWNFPVLSPQIVTDTISFSGGESNSVVIVQTLQ